MAPRRAHTKSRHGCDQCKKRRVKCDEREPICMNCTARDIDCHYSRRAPSSSSNSNSSAQSPASTGHLFALAPSIAHSPGGSPDGYPGSYHVTTANNMLFCPSIRQRELELMQHWFTKTCKSFTNSYADVFRGPVVQEALKHEFLMDSIFGLTSLHIASETSDPVSAAFYVRGALQYQNNAVPTFSAALHNMTQSNCEAVLVSSVLVLACSMVSPLLPAGDSDAAKSALDRIILIYEFVEGIRSIVTIGHQWLQSSPLRDIFIPPRLFQLSGEEETIYPIKMLRSLSDTSIGVSNPLYQMYQDAIQELERCFAEGKRIGVSWLSVAGKDFVYEIQRKERMALMIFMFWGVHVHKLDELWWAQRSGKTLVEELCRSFDGYGSEWDEAVSWAMLEVGL